MPKAPKYDQSFKDEVTGFVQQYNVEHDWGGQTAAIKKYGISGLTIKSWLDKAGVVTPGRGGRRSGDGSMKAGTRTRKTKAVRGTRARRSTSRKVSFGKDLEARLNRMLELRNEIAHLEQEFESLRKSL